MHCELVEAESGALRNERWVQDQEGKPQITSEEIKRKVRNTAPPLNTMHPSDYTSPRLFYFFLFLWMLLWIFLWVVERSSISGLCTSASTWNVLLSSRFKKTHTHTRVGS